MGLNVSAQTTSSAPTVEELQKQIQLLLSQLGSLQKEVTSLKSAVPTPTTSVTTPAIPTISPLPTITPLTPTVIDESEIDQTEIAFTPPPTLTRSLFRGSRGEDVRQLQEFLSQDPTIYPEGLATGFYGAGTEAAVRKWQAKNGLPSVGVIGRQTIAKFKEIYSGVVSGLRNQQQTIGTGPLVRPTLPTDDIKVPPTDTKKEVCPALPTVDSCLAGEERVVTYKSAQCGVFYACKPRSTPAPENNTYADIKPATFGQETNRYSITLYDSDGIQKYSIMQANGAEVYFGYPGCRPEAPSSILVLEKSSFPIKVVMADCRSGAKSSVELNVPAQTTTTTTGSIFPYKFSNGKIVYSSADARSYCYANGPGTGQGVASECETKFGIVYQTITATTNSNWVQRTWNFRDGQTATSYILNRTDAEYANYLAPVQAQCLTINKSQLAWKSNAGDSSAANWQNFGIPDCSGTTTTATPVAGQKEQVWNSLGLRSWIRTDADSARINQLLAACASVSGGANIWTPNAGTSSSVDFGMPSAEKCRVATTCSSSQYFDGAACVTSTTSSTYACSDGRDNDGDGLIDYPNDTGCYAREDTSEDIPTTTTTSCSQYGSGWHTMGSDSTCFDTNMTNYRTANGTLYSCSSTPATGCSGTTTTTTSSSCDSSLIALLGDGCHQMYTDSSGNQIFCDTNMSKSAKRGASTTIPGCFSPTSSTQTTLLYEDSAALCSDGIDNDRDGLIDSADSSCTSYTTTTTTSTGSCSQYGSGWHTMGSDGNCFDTYMTNYRTANSALYSCSTTPTTGCSSSSSTTSSASCTSGQYWNGTACVTSTTSSSCGSGQYWDGSACVASPGYTDPSTACAQAGGSWNTSSSYCQMPTSSGSSSCTSGQYWNGTACVTSSTTSTSCPSGQYWSGSACVNTSTTNCTSGQYWNGTACVSSTPSASVYDQMRDQLKSMEIILRGLLGR